MSTFSPFTFNNYLMSHLSLIINKIMSSSFSLFSHLSSTRHQLQLLLPYSNAIVLLIACRPLSSYLSDEWSLYLYLSFSFSCSDLEPKLGGRHSQDNRRSMTLVGATKYASSLFYRVRATIGQIGRFDKLGLHLGDNKV